MGTAVWEFMWLIDRVTGVRDNGEGVVLGGKPILLDDIADSFGVSRLTTQRNMDLLEEQGYIRKIRTPKGISFRVVRAKKRFGGKVKGSIINDTSVEEGSIINDTSKGSIINDTSNIRQGSIDRASSPSAPNGAVNEKVVSDLIFEMQSVNPSYKQLFSRKVQRDAMGRLLGQYGEKKMRDILRFLPKSNANAYAPTITTPVQLEEKLGALLAWGEKEKHKRESKKTNVV